MTRLLLAEWLKCRRWPVNWALIGLLPCLLLTQFLLDALGARDTAERVLAFPNSLGVVVGGMTKLSALLAVTFVAGNLGEEYAKNRWKESLPRRPGRAGFLLAKALMGGVALLLWTVGTVACGLLVAVTLSQLVGVPASAPRPEVAATLGRLAASTCEALLYGATAFVAAVLMRSSFSAVFFGLVPLKVLDYVAPRLGAAQALLPVVHLRNLEARLTDWPAPLACGTGVSLLALFIYAASCLIVAIGVFQRQEFGGDG